MAKVSKQKARRRIPDVLTGEERAALLKIPNPRYISGLRNRCLLQVMTDTGLRCAEAIKLKPGDIKWKENRLIVREGKGGDDRALPLNQDLLGWLKRWQEARPKGAKTFFTTIKGGKLSDRYVRKMVERYAERACIADKHVHPHTLRHSFATETYRKTKNLRLTQKMLGHKSISTTMIYTHVSDEEAETAMAEIWT